MNEDFMNERGKVAVHILNIYIYIYSDALRRDEKCELKLQLID